MPAQLPHDPRPVTRDPLALSESTLARLWAGQRLPASALVTRQGVPLRVLHPGRPGRAAGPDFRDTVIAAPSGTLLRGDVELHLRASDFRAHGHHRDRRYDGVVLHLVLEDDLAEDTRLASGRRAPVIALAPWVRRRAQELEGWLARPGLWREPCHDAAVRLGRENVLRTLETLGDRRFRERQAALADAVRTRGPGEALYRALMEGIGYGSERGPLLAVADVLPWRELSALLAAAEGEEEGAVVAEALLLGAAGLLPCQDRGAARHPHEERLEETWRASGGRAVDAPALGQGRPANHPARRLAGLAQLLARRGQALERRAEAGPLEGSAAGLIAAWTASAKGYWADHFAPGIPAARPPGALIGRSRAIELLVNAVLPWAAAGAEAVHDAEGAARAHGAFSCLPRPARYGVLAFLETNLRGDAGTLPLDARRQQGLLALYKSECTQGGCGRCPLS